MAKRSFHPFILRGSDPGGSVIGGGTGQGGLNTPSTPISYSAWLESDWRDDYILDNTIDERDYVAWWEFCSFTEAQWDELYPGEEYLWGY